MVEVSLCMLDCEWANPSISVMHGRGKHASPTANASRSTVSLSRAREAVLVIGHAAPSDLFAKLSRLKGHLVEGMANCILSRLRDVTVVGPSRSS